MLDRDEISSILPCITERKTISKKNNIVKKTELNNRSIDLFLPIRLFSPNKKIVSSFKQARGKHIEIKKSNYLPVKQSDNRVKYNDKCLHGNPITIKSIRNTLKTAREQLNSYDNEPNAQIYKAQCFNLKSLKSRVKVISDSLKIKGMQHHRLKSLDQKTFQLRKDKSKSLQQYNKHDKDNEDDVCDFEYKLMINQMKHSRNRPIEQPYIINTLPTIMRDATISNNNLSNRTNSHQNNYSQNNKTTTHHYHHFRSKSKAMERQLLIQIEKQYLDRFDNDQLDFNDKYRTSIIKMNKEAKRHSIHDVFRSRDIDSIMKSKTDVVIDILMSKYISKYNKYFELKTKPQHNIRLTKNKEEAALKNKAKRKETIQNKLNNALVELDKGSLIKGKYIINNYIKGLSDNNLLIN